ncbi:efflux RND transporter permease subunit [Roseivirga pacifica]|uniref:efflux RND transporter permease subunit n=1 Tax=Roseivirga pacifica TaxID=1267423 RepID=UPI003BA97E18
MVRFLIKRPIAVLLSFLGLLVFSVLAIRHLPISLLPGIEVPSIVVKVDYPNNPARIIENSVLNPIRTELNALNNLKSMESTATSESGVISLQFNYGTRMDLAYIEINEKIDRLQESLPRDMDRPRIIRVNTSDIPIIRIQVTPRAGTDFIELSELTERVLKKRLEQLDGVSIVDINGTRSEFIAINPYRAQLEALNITESQIEQTLKTANQELGQLSIKDGQYRYFVRMANRLDDIEEIKKLPVKNPDGDVVPLSRLASISFEQEKVQSYHLFQGQESLVITVHKQANAKMTELTPLVYDAVELFKKEYTEADFDLTQDQSSLLNAGISNLSTSLIYGGVFAFAVLFLFMGNYRLPIIMGITLPVSLIISFLLFYAVGLSINIISLSGLALGLGMLIDNAIIVIDNISRKRSEGLGLTEACISGVNEVMSPLISSVLTTLAVFVPLVFLNGLSGSLFYDQAVSVAIILGASLMVAFILLPLLYRLFFGKSEKRINEDSAFFRLILKGYKSIFKLVWKFKAVSLAVLVLLIPLAYLLLNSLPKTGLPEIEKTETLVTIQWNAPIDVAANKARLQSILAEIPENTVSESDIGLSQFLLSISEGSVERANLYLKFADQQQKAKIEAQIAAFLSQSFPEATFEITDAPNAFDQIFVTEGSYFVAKWKNLGESEPMKPAMMTTLKQASEQNIESESIAGKGFVYENALEGSIDTEALSTYGINEGAFKTALGNALDGYLVTEIRRFGEVTPIKITRPQTDLQQQLQQVFVSGARGEQYPVSRFVNFSFSSTEKNITADRTGIYQSLEWDEISESEIKTLTSKLPAVASQEGLTVDFDGTYFEDQENLQQLLFILAISVALLYFILAAQFESLVQPLIVIFTLPLGILGALIIIYISGATLNVMSAIGIIVMLGIMVNDAILKIDTINRLAGAINKDQSTDYRAQLTAAIAKTGEIRLKPILMTSITTILALLPVVFADGIGADLQRPLVFAVIGGLTIGTFTALYFVPLAYWFLSRKVFKS